MKDGAFSPEDLVLRAAELGMSEVALTDRDGLYGVARSAEAFGTGASGDLSVEVQHRREPDSPGEVRHLLRFADQAGVPAVATNAVRYLVPEDAFLADVLECMREIVPIAAHHVSRRNAEGYLKSAKEMREVFAERPELCDATLDVADRCRFDLGIGTVHFPDFPTPERSE